MHEGCDTCTDGVNCDSCIGTPGLPSSRNNDNSKKKFLLNSNKKCFYILLILSLFLLR